MNREEAAQAERTSAGRRRYRVLHFVSTFALKTDTKWLLQIAEHLDRTRFQLSVACFYQDGEVRDLLRRMGVETHNLDAPVEWDPRAIIRARDVIRESAADLVHTHLLRADLFAGAAARWAGVPAIVSTVYAIGAYRRAIRRRSDGLLDSACSLLPTHLLAVSDAVREDCVVRLGFPGERVRVIHTGIDPPREIDAAASDAIRRDCLDAPNGRLVLTAARLSYEKGIDVLIDAAARVRQRHPAARFAIIGDGPDRASLHRRIESAGLERFVRLAGFQADVWPWLKAADVFCLPSLSEGMPNVVLEAMAAGRTIVATRVGGVPEAIEHERNGLLVPPGDPVALAAALDRALIGGPVIESLGVGARQTVDQRFLARDVVARYAEWYESLIESRDP